MKLAEKIAEELKSGKGNEAQQTFSSQIKELVEIVHKTASWSKFPYRIEGKDVESLTPLDVPSTQGVAWISYLLKNSHLDLLLIQ